MEKQLTVNDIYTRLQELISEGHGSKPIMVSKTTFGHVLESDGATICSVKNVVIDWVPEIDDDGGLKMDEEGQEVGETMAIIQGFWSSSL